MLATSDKTVPNKAIASSFGQETIGDVLRFEPDPKESVPSNNVHTFFIDATLGFLDWKLTRKDCIRIEITHNASRRDIVST
ncbi:hypothetical protein D3C87_1306020 [compost metagenome]